MMFTSISESRRSHHDAPMVLEENPILDAFRDLDDPSDPWGDAMVQLGAIDDALSITLDHGEEVQRDISVEFEYVLRAIGFGLHGHGEDHWPTLVETTFYYPDLRQDWLYHAREVTARRESFTRLLGLDY